MHYSREGQGWSGAQGAGDETTSVKLHAFEIITGISEYKCQLHKIHAG
jgi:hypothetical protein